MAYDYIFDNSYAFRLLGKLVILGQTTDQNVGVPIDGFTHCTLYIAYSIITLIIMKTALIIV